MCSHVQPCAARTPYTKTSCCATSCLINLNPFQHSTELTCQWRRRACRKPFTGGGPKDHQLAMPGAAKPVETLAICSSNVMDNQLLNSPGNDFFKSPQQRIAKNPQKNRDYQVPKMPVWMRLSNVVSDLAVWKTSSATKSDSASACNETREGPRARSQTKIRNVMIGQDNPNRLCDFFDFFRISDIMLIHLSVRSGKKSKWNVLWNRVHWKLIECNGIIIIIIIIIIKIKVKVDWESASVLGFGKSISQSPNAKKVVLKLAKYRECLSI